MSDAMLGMMQAMGSLFGAASATTGGGAQWSGSASQPWQAAAGMMENIATMPQIADKLPSRTELEGTWYGQNGEWLAFKDYRFRMLTRANARMEGIIYLRDNLAAFHSPAQNKTWVFEYAHEQGRLVLRDAQRRLYLFRRATASIPPAGAATQDIGQKATNPADDG